MDLDLVLAAKMDQSTTLAADILGAMSQREAKALCKLTDVVLKDHSFIKLLVAIGMSVVVQALDARCEEAANG